MGHPAKHTVEEHPFLDKLIAKLGKVAASEAIGLTNVDTSVPVRVAYELAAQLVWERDHADSRAVTYYMVKLPSAQREAFEPVAKALGATLTVWRL